MFKFFLFGKSKKYLGIDIGTSSIKIVEISRSKNKINLDNYGEKINRINEEELQNNLRTRTFFLSEEEIADNIKEILKEAEIKTKEAIFSVPDFMSFFTVLTMPWLPKNEIASVVNFEAKQYIPLPLKDINLDWLLIEEKENKNKRSKELKILLAAVPNKTILKYQRVANLAGISLLSIEAEIFSLIRASIKKEETARVIQLIDFGIQSTTIAIVEGGSLQLAYSIDFSNNENIAHLASGLNINYNEAEEIIKRKGLIDNQTGPLMKLKVDDLISESKQIANNFFRNEKKEVEKIIFAGGPALTPGLLEYFSEKTGKKVEIVNPFFNISYPPILEEKIKEIGPRYSVAVGLSLREINNKSK